MASRTWASWGALALALSVSAGCDGEKGNRFPPPQPYPGGPIVKPGGSGDAGGGAGGTAGGGGTAGSGGAAAVPNLCECVLGSYNDATCGDCVNAALAPGGSCESFDAACKALPACDDLLKCGDDCKLQPAVEQIPCIQACYGQVDLASPDNHDFVNLMTCLCNTHCASECAPSAPIACE